MQGQLKRQFWVCDDCGDERLYRPDFAGLPVCHCRIGIPPAPLPVPSGKPMRRVEIVYQDVADGLAEALREIADGYERHNPGWWIKKARAALAAYARSAR